MNGHGRIGGGVGDFFVVYLYPLLYLSAAVAADVKMRICPCPKGCDEDLIWEVKTNYRVEYRVPTW